MSYKIRHEGSPRSIEDLTPAEVVEGLQEGLWEPTDEIMGPQDSTWVPIESHPQFAEVALELEPPPPKVHEDETTLDMNPLIDVTMVLLIFFMLTTSYAALQKILDMPGSSPRDKAGPAVISQQKAAETLIKVEALQVQGKPVIRIEGREVPRHQLLPELSRFVKETRKSEILLDAAGDVDWETVIAIQDAAKGARIDKVRFLVRKDDL